MVCPICLGAPQAPVVCPCPGEHAFCRACLRELQQLACPVCRSATPDVAAFLFELAEPQTRSAAWRAAQVHVAASAGHCAILRALRSWGTAMDAPDEDGNTPLHGAVAHACVGAVKHLAALRAGLDAPDGYGYTPLRVAASKGDAVIAQVLVAAGADTEKADVGGQTPLFAAARKGHADVVKVLAEAGAAVGDAREIAEHAGHRQVVRYLSLRPPPAKRRRKH